MVLARGDVEPRVGTAFSLSEERVCARAREYTSPASTHATVEFAQPPSDAWVEALLVVFVAGSLRCSKFQVD